MATKVVKVADVTFNREYKTPAGSIIFYFNMKDEDDQLYQFSTIKQQQTKFEIGKSYDISIVEKSNSRGTYLFADYSDKQKESIKGSGGSGSSYSGAKGGYKGYTRSRKEVLMIISQSSYTAAATICAKLVAINPSVKINSHTQIASISKQLMNYILEESGLNSDEAKKGNTDALKAANEKSIAYQTALKIAVICLDIPDMESTLATGMSIRSTPGIIAVTDMILNDIISIANEL